MKRYKVREVIKMLEQDGWILSYTRGDNPPAILGTSL